MTYDPGAKATINQKIDAALFENTYDIKTFFKEKNFNVTETDGIIECTRKIPDHPDGLTERYVFSPSNVSLETRNMEDTFNKFGMILDHETGQVTMEGAISTEKMQIFKVYAEMNNL